MTTENNPNLQRFLEDQFDIAILSTIVDIRIAEAEIHLACARDDLVTHFGYKSTPLGHSTDDDPPSLSARRDELCTSLAKLEPRSILSARQMLELAIHRIAKVGASPDTQFDFELFQMLKGILRGLENLPGETPLISAEE